MLALPYFMLLRASGLFAKDETTVHTVYCLRRGDVVSDEKDGMVQRWTWWRRVSEDLRLTKGKMGLCW